MQTSTSDVSSEIADLTEVALTHLEQLPETALAASLRRILRDARDPDAPLAAFDSSLAD
ncbi:FxSxx-COOH cyclophane-containing RiPP peptide [Streptacidiphilus griseoplanus]|uniref:FxSxx-COOH cyclophane-containing RiPP peptide n=1 Tax=Peterkaempfera griseoplana TaxID=66896 RepID=UPI000AB02CB2|nr:FxSxx-COOH cyclophane-containing RiPP peptide [Peterkaempfera griseoplana]